MRQRHCRAQVNGNHLFPSNFLTFHVHSSAKLWSHGSKFEGRSGDPRSDRDVWCQKVGPEQPSEAKVAGRVTHKSPRKMYVIIHMKF